MKIRPSIVAAAIVLGASLLAIVVMGMALLATSGRATIGGVAAADEPAVAAAPRPPWEQDCPDARDVNASRDPRYGPAADQTPLAFFDQEAAMLLQLGRGMASLRDAAYTSQLDEPAIRALGCAQRRNPIRATQLRHFSTEHRIEVMQRDFSAAIVQELFFCVDGEEHSLAAPHCATVERLVGTSRPPLPSDLQLRVRETLIRARGDSAWLHRFIDDDVRERTLASWAAEDVPYGALERNADNWIGEPAVYSGRVEEIHDGDDGVTMMRVALRSGGRDVLWVETVGVPPDRAIVSGSRVRVYGYLARTFTYESQAGWNITIPAMFAVVVEARR